MTEPAKAVFLNYPSQDAESAGSSARPCSEEMGKESTGTFLRFGHGARSKQSRAVFGT